MWLIWGISTSSLTNKPRQYERAHTHTHTRTCNSRAVLRFFRRLFQPEICMLQGCQENNKRKHITKQADRKQGFDPAGKVLLRACIMFVLRLFSHDLFLHRRLLETGTVPMCVSGHVTLQIGNFGAQGADWGTQFSRHHLVFSKCFFCKKGFVGYLRLFDLFEYSRFLIW